MFLPLLEALDDRRLDGDRQVRLRAGSDRDADGMIFIVSGDRAVQVVELEGRAPAIRSIQDIVVLGNASCDHLRPMRT